MVLVLLDIKKASPNVCRDRCWKTLARGGVPESMLAVVRMLHYTTQYKVLTKIDESELFELRRGLREGCPSSCVIYNIYHEATLRRLAEKSEAPNGPQARRL